MHPGIPAPHHLLATTSQGFGHVVAAEAAIDAWPNVWSCGHCTWRETKTSGWWWLEHDWIIFPYSGNNHPNWLSYVSEGLEPPTSLQSWFIINKSPLFQTIIWDSPMKRCIFSSELGSKSSIPWTLALRLYKDMLKPRKQPKSLCSASGVFERFFAFSCLFVCVFLVSPYFASNWIHLLRKWYTLYGWLWWFTHKIQEGNVVMFEFDHWACRNMF